MIFSFIIFLYGSHFSMISLGNILHQVIPTYPNSKRAIFSKYSTYKYKQCILLKSILISLWPSNSRQIIFTIVNFHSLLKFRIHKTTNKTLLSHFLRLSYGCSARHLPGKNRRVWGASSIPQLCLEHYICVCIGR
jgi:hypothetical protein